MTGPYRGSTALVNTVKPQRPGMWRRFRCWLAVHKMQDGFVIPHSEKQDNIGMWVESRGWLTIGHVKTHVVLTKCLHCKHKSTRIVELERVELETAE